MLEPLTIRHLPHELLARIIDFLSLSSIARLARTSQWLHNIVYELSADSISTSLHHHRSGNYRFFSDRDECFTQYLSSARTWEELGRHYRILHQACRHSSDMPWTQEAFISFDRPVWYFRPDVKNRWVIVVGPESFIQIKDMDTGETLFDFPDPNPHTWTIRYHDGWLLLPVAYNYEGQYQIEIWKAQTETRGHFKRYDIMFPPEQFKDYHLAWPNMYVLGVQGMVWIYDVRWPALPPVAYSVKPAMTVYMTSNAQTLLHNIKWREYLFINRSSRNQTGSITPYELRCPFKHVIPKPSSQRQRQQEEDLTESPLPMRPPSTDRLQRLQLAPGPLPKQYQRSQNIVLSQERWQQAALDGRRLVANSIGGRILICMDWHKAMRSTTEASRLSLIIEFSLDEPMLHQHISAKDGRVIFEANNQTIMLILPDDSVTTPNTDLNIFAVPNASEPRLNRPLAAFQMLSDSFMTTYALRAADDEPRDAIRVLSFAPPEP